MKKLLISGGNKIVGRIEIAGAKNATLPLMVASILTDQELKLKNIPHVSDIATMANLLVNFGVEVGLDGFDEDGGFAGRVFSLRAKNLSNFCAPYDLVCKMRASIFALGPLLARVGKAQISLPGGCAIGTRPVDLHLKAMQKLGAKIDVVNGYIDAQVLGGRLVGNEINFEKVSVGATESVMMAACLARGETVLNNAALEPEIVDLASCLKKMGAEIHGAGTSQITIQGKDALNGASHQVIADRIEAGTYAIAAAITGGRVILSGIEMWVLKGFAESLKEAGVIINRISDTEIEIIANGNEIKPVNISTQPFPGFPTDMQAQFMALMTLANGTSTIEENIFENRFMHILELARMGANIEAHGNLAQVKGVKELSGAEVMATDLRASVCLVLAALAAKGQTVINRLYHLERGYERLAEKLVACGANIKVLY